MTTCRPHKPGHQRPIPFGLCTIGEAAALTTPDVRCCDCAHGRRMTATAWLGCTAGHVPHRALAALLPRLAPIGAAGMTRLRWIAYTLAQFLQRLGL